MPKKRVHDFDISKPLPRVCFEFLLNKIIDLIFDNYKYILVSKGIINVE